MSIHSFSFVKSQLSGKTLLITGCSGFIGKVVLEKILRTLSEVEQVLVLVRSNSQYSKATDRFNAEIKTSSIFDKLREQPNFDTLLSSKVTIIDGELTADRFGMSTDEFIKLAHRTDLIINSAASVNFREELDKALIINTLCLNNFVRLSDINRDLRMLQISTCYVNGFHTDNIFEEVKGPAGALISTDANGNYDIGGLISNLEIDIDAVKESCTEANALSEQLIALGTRKANQYGWNDTYTLTKWMGEHLLKQAFAGRSLTIVRPSIVESTLLDPVPGWIEGVKVVDAVTMAYVRQKVSFFPGREGGVIDVIPVDYVANAVLLASAELIKEPLQFKVYQVCSGSSNPIGIKQFKDILHASVKANWRKLDRLCLVEPKKDFRFVNRGLFMFCMRVARSVINITSKLPFTTDQSRLLSKLDTGISLANIFSFYTAPNYIFHNEKLMQLANKAGVADYETYTVDVKKIEWATYMGENHLFGLNQYALQPRKNKVGNNSTANVA